MSMMSDNEIVERITTYIIDEERDKQLKRFSEKPKSDEDVVKNVLDVLGKLVPNEDKEN